MAQHIVSLDILASKVDIIKPDGIEKGKIEVRIYINDKCNGMLVMSKDEWEGFKRHIVHAKIDEV